MKKYKKWSLCFILTLNSALLLVAGINFTFDPLQQYRKASFYTPVYKKERYMNPGLAKTHSYDTVVVGTSMIENCRPSYIDEVLGSKSIKLPFSAGSAREEGLMISVAMRNKKLQKVILGVDVFSFKGKPDRLSYGPGSIPFYLYDENPFNDVKYLLSFDTLEFYKYLIRTNLLGKKKAPTTYDAYEFWGHKHKYGRELVWDHWRSGEFNSDFRKEDFAYERLKTSFDVNLLPLFKNNPQVQFDLFFPPYSPFVWADLHLKGVLEQALAFKKYIVSNTQFYSNVKIHDFQDEEEITFNLDNYKDVSHYKPELNDRIIDFLVTGEYLVDQSSIDTHLGNLKEQTFRFMRQNQITPN